jgi:hypothetical protein
MHAFPPIDCSDSFFFIGCVKIIHGDLFSNARCVQHCAFLIELDLKVVASSAGESQTNPARPRVGDLAWLTALHHHKKDNMQTVRRQEAIASSYPQ